MKYITKGKGRLQPLGLRLSSARISAVIFHNLTLTSALGKKLPHLKSVPKSKYESPGAVLPLSANTMLGG